MSQVVGSWCHHVTDRPEDRITDGIRGRRFLVSDE